MDDLRTRTGKNGWKNILGRIFRAGRKRREREETLLRLSVANRDLTEAVRALYLERLHLLDDLATLYFDLREDDATLLRKKDRTREEVLMDFRRRIRSLCGKESMLQGLARTVDIMKNGVATLLEKDFPKMQPEERTLLLLLYLEAGPDVVACFSGKSSGTVRSVKSRFLKKLAQADLPEADKEILRTSFQKRG